MPLDRHGFGGRGRAAAVTPQFERTDLVLGTSPNGFVTAMTFGPDGRLYAAQQISEGNARILAITLDESGTDVLDFDTVIAGLDLVLGMAFDPMAAQRTLYLSRQESGDAPPYQGRIRKLAGQFFTPTDVITGLPNDSLTHFTNGLAFDASGRLFIAQGSMTEAGANGIETPLSAAILVADVHDPSFDGDVTYDPPGPPLDNNVDQTGGNVEVFAPGLRNPYDLVVHTNGRIYATDNGPACCAVSSSCTETSGGISPNDELNLIEEGMYYGHPNRNRGRFDPSECVYHPPQEPSSGRYRAPIAVMPPGSTCNGIAEYTSDAFDGEMTGDLLCAGLDGKLRRAVLSEDGATIEAVEVIASDLPGALDVAVRADGTIYVSGTDAIYILSPTVPGQTPSPTPTPAFVTGDADCNDAVNAIDVALILQFAADLLTTLPCELAADANGDGAVSSTDAALVLQYVAGLLGHLPPPARRA